MTDLQRVRQRTVPKNVGIAYIQILQGPIDMGTINTLSCFETSGTDFKMT